MKQRFLFFARTGVLGLTLAALTGCPETAESVRVPVVVAEEEGAEEKVKPAQGTDKAAVTTVSVAATNSVNAEVKQQLAPVIPNLSPGLSEIIRLAQAKVGEDVLLAYIARSSHAYNPTTEEIIYLHDLGVSDAAVAEIVKRSPMAATQMAEQKPAATEPLNIPEVKVPATQPGPVLTPLVSTNPGPAYVEQQTVVVQQPIIIEQPIVIQQAPEEVRYFYTSLAPYGSWVDVAGYGWCWQPTVAVTYAGWRPYHQGGRWLYTDSGWYWQSDYSWGWAPFHYGRWFNHPRRGWCWTPDRVWGPAWVSWRTSSSYCGWAPLPPVARYRSGFGLSYYDRHVGVSFEFGLGASDYTFVSHEHFYTHNPYRHCLPASHGTRVYNQTVVNNVIVQGNNNNVVINQGGAPVTQISKATRMDVQKVNVVDLPAAQRSGVQPDRLVREGGTLAVYRPTGPTSTASRSAQEPVKAAIAGGRPAGSPPPASHAPATLQLQSATPNAPAPAVTARPSAPNTVLQRFEAPRPTELPTLSRPQTGSSMSAEDRARASVGMPTQPAGTGIDRPLTPQSPVQPARPTPGRGLTQTVPSKRPPEATRPMSAPQPVSGPVVTPSAPQPISGPTVTLSQPQPVYGAPATPSASRPVQPATPAQSRLTPPQPVSSYQAPPTAALRNEPSKPSTFTPASRPAGTYGQRPSQPQQNYGVSSSQLPRAAELPRASELPRAAELPRANTMRPQPSTSYSAPTYNQPSTPTYNAPTTRTYEPPRQTYSQPAPRPTYTPPAPTVQPQRNFAPQSVTLPPVSAPSRPSPSVSLPANRPSQGQSGNNENKRPGSR